MSRDLVGEEFTRFVVSWLAGIACEVSQITELLDYDVNGTVTNVMAGRRSNDSTSFTISSLAVWLTRAIATAKACPAQSLFSPCIQSCSLSASGLTQKIKISKRFFFHNAT